MRWEHPEHGLLLPGEFLPDAERTGVIVPVGNWTIEHACRQMADWHSGGGPTLKLNLNLSARQFGEPTLPAQLKRIIGDTGLAPGSLWLEVTEATLLDDHDASDMTLRQLHEIGVRLVIDDFGTGTSSLVSLKQFPIDAIKIASTFVGDLGRDRDSDAICSAIVDLAHSLGLVRDRRGRRDARAVRGVAGARLRAGPGSPLRSGAPAEEYGAAPAGHARCGRHRPTVLAPTDLDLSTAVRHPGAMRPVRTRAGVRVVRPRSHVRSPTAVLARPGRPRRAAEPRRPTAIARVAGVRRWVPVRDAHRAARPRGARPGRPSTWR